MVSFLRSDFKECGTEIDSIRYLSDINEFSIIKNTIDRQEMPDIIWAPITFHIVRNDNGTGGLPPHRIDIGLQDMLNIYAGNSNFLMHVLWIPV